MGEGLGLCYLSVSFMDRDCIVIYVVSVRVIDIRFRFTGIAVAGFLAFADTNGGREMIHTTVFGVLVSNHWLRPCFGRSMYSILRLFVTSVSSDSPQLLKSLRLHP